ncbi:MAG: hypothetical protein J6V99_09240 [Neisseriaceae bacterium]|nr:hypothetical protein [Neisseriaceae bacterium]
MAQAKNPTTLVTGAFIKKAMCMALFALSFSSVVAEPTLDDLLQQSHSNRQQRKRQIKWTEVQNKPLNNQEEANRAKTVIFISQSIPENDLIRLLDQGSGRDDVLFVYRGFIGGENKNSIDFMKKLAQRYMKSKKPMPHVMVYPQAFRAYNVGKVPAVLHQNADGNWYMAQGGLNINNAIAAIERHQYKMPLSRQWKVAEPDQAEYMREQTRRIAIQNQEKWDNYNANLVQQKIQGEITLPYAKADKTDLFTPYYTLPEDIIDPKTKKVIAPKGTKINILGNDTDNGGSILIVDGRDVWQVNFANEILKKDADAIIFYTQKGKLPDGIALPLDKGIAERLSVQVVPTLLIKKGNQFERRIYKRQ